MSSFSLGRSSTNDLQVTDPHVSAHHARLVRDAEGLWIEHLSRTPGVFTYVNGRPVSRARVSPGDRIELSHHYHLDWGNHSLVRWLSSGALVERGPIRSSSPARAGFPDDHLLVTPSTLWLVLGAFFFIGYFLPVSPGAFYWDAFRFSTMDGIVTLFMALAGIAIIPIAYAVHGLSRAVSLLSVGFAGLLLHLVQTIRTADTLNSTLGGVLGAISIVFLTAMLALNNVVISQPSRRTVRILAGVSASVYSLVLILAQIGVISLLTSDSFDRPLAAVTFGFTILFFITMLGAAVLVMVNFKKAPCNSGNAALAERIVLIALLAQLMVVSVLAGAGSQLSGGWVLLLMFRAFGFLYGMAVVFGGGLSDLLKITGR